MPSDLLDSPEEDIGEGREVDLFFCDKRYVTQNHIEPLVHRSKEAMNKTNVLKKKDKDLCHAVNRPEEIIYSLVPWYIDHRKISKSPTSLGQQCWVTKTLDGLHVYQHSAVYLQIHDFDSSGSVKQHFLMEERQ